MDILTLIKNRASIRKYKDKPIPKKIIKKIIEAGRWGPSVPSFLRIQPWYFVIIINKKKIKLLSQICIKKSKSLGAGANILLHSAGNIINSSNVVILIYNSGDMNTVKEKFKFVYENFGIIIQNAVLSAISATIQNMILTAENLGVGSCWLDTPLFCKKEITEFFNTKDELVAVLTLGYPVEEGKRAPRKAISNTLKFIV